MEELPDFKRNYHLNGNEIQVMGWIFKDDYGCYRCSMLYRTPECREDEIPGWIDDGLGIWRETEIPLNGPGKKKLERKVVKFLESNLEEIN